METLTEERIAKNDAAFREANEKIERTAADSDLQEAVPFLCECADVECTEIVRLSLDDYREVRSEAKHFINAPGHHVAAHGAARVIAERDGYEIVEKLGRAAEIAEDLDTRS